MAWPHVNSHGRFEFAKQPAPIDPAGMVQEMARRPILIEDVEPQCTFLRGNARNPMLYAQILCKPRHVYCRLRHVPTQLTGAVAGTNLKHPAAGMPVQQGHPPRMVSIDQRGGLTIGPK